MFGVVDAPTVTQLLQAQPVRAAIENAWADSMPGDRLLRHEEGGWILEKEGSE